MSGKYKAVGWNRQKKIYDTTFLLLLVVCVVAFIVSTLIGRPGATAETLLLRSTAIAAFTLLHVILCIGPLARLNSRFLPFLYNRRHLGVVMFLLALVHAVLATIQFHAFGPNNPLVSIFTAYRMEYSFGSTGSSSHFPFEPFGLLALGILFLMAATSHDFWLRTLGAAVWKSIHTLVYLAYGSLIVHVAFGALQYETSPLLAVIVAGGFITVVGLHIVAGARERAIDELADGLEVDGYLRACDVSELKEGCGKTVIIEGERRAVFLHNDRVYALSNVCRHQGGPISEGRILDGCITCPWHGWQYAPDTGVSPPPFHEVLETYPVRIVDRVVYVKSEALSAEQKSDGVSIAGESS